MKSDTQSRVAGSGNVKILIALGVPAALLLALWWTLVREPSSVGGALTAEPGDQQGPHRELGDVVAAPGESQRDPVAATEPATAAATQAASDPEAPDETPAPAAGSSSALGAQATALLELSAASFLTAAPDLEGLDRAMERLAQASAVDQDSVYKDPQDGSIRGKLSIPGIDFQASFQLAGDRYRIRFEPIPGNPLPPQFIGRQLEISFLASSGQATQASTVVQYHPDPKASSAAFLQPGSETYAGWTVDVGPGGTSAQPISLKQAPDGSGWIVGRSPTLAKIQNPWGTSSAACAAWLTKLSALSK